MIAIMIERWTNRDGSTDYRWSVWRDGHRLDMGGRPHADAEECEKEARAYCVETLGQEPDKVSHL